MNQPILPKGVITATVTPMNADLSIDTGLLFDHCQYIFENGGNGILLMGTTGEANAFSIAERMAALEDLIERGISPAKLLVGTGTCSITETEVLTRHAVNAGAAGVLVMPPFYYRAVTRDGIFAYFATLFERVEVPFQLYLYHFPAMSGVDISLKLLEQLIESFPDRFVGIKDSGGDLNHMLEILGRFPDFRLYSGTERFLIETLDNGSQGCISATTNYSIRYVAAVYEKYMRGEGYSNDLKNMLGARSAFEGNVLAAAIKGILHMESSVSNWRNMRPPLTLPDESVLRAIKAELDALG